MNSTECERRTNDLRLQDLLGELQGFQLSENLSEYSAIEGRHSDGGLKIKVLTKVVKVKVGVLFKTAAGCADLRQPDDR